MQCRSQARESSMALIGAAQKQPAAIAWSVDGGAEGLAAVAAVAIERARGWAAAATADGVCVRQVHSGEPVLQAGTGPFAAVAVLPGGAVLGAGEQGLFRLVTDAGASSSGEQLSPCPATALAQQPEAGRVAVALGRQAPLLLPGVSPVARYLGESRARASLPGLGAGRLPTAGA